MIQPLAIDLRSLRMLVGPDIKIIPGRAMMARVVAAQGGRGSLSIAGLLMEAELPADVKAGEDLRLVVSDVNAERVLLKISEHHEGAHTPEQAPPGPQPAQAQPPVDVPPPVMVPLPGGGTVHVTERDAGSPAGASDAGAHALSMRYDAPTLGAVDLQFALDPATLTLAVAVAPGQALELARQGAEALRQALSQQLGRSVTVTVTPRRQPLDLYA